MNPNVIIHSKPSCTYYRRFFKPYNVRPATAQQKEVNDRQEILSKLKLLEGQIYDINSKIQVELSQIVTYAGVPIKEKMKYDYSEMIKKVESDRKIIKLAEDSLTPKG